MKKIIGIYKISPTIESIIVAAKYHKFYWQFNNDGKYSYNENLDNIADLYLIEIQVFGLFSPDLLMVVSQNDQAPYLEFYLDPSGIRLIEEDEAIRLNGRRICFFMHYLNIDIPLIIEDQEFDLQNITDLPERLKPFTHYVPVD